MLQHFRPNITLNIELTNFNDEDVNAEKFMELVGFYNIREVMLSKCSCNLKATSLYLLGPPKVLRASNSFMKFVRIDQVLNAELLRLENCRLNIKLNSDRLFANVKRAYFNNCYVKDCLFFLFS